MNGVLNKLIESYPELAQCKDDIDEAFKLMKESYYGNGKLLICGNGGSAADSEHIVGELMKGFNKKRPLAREMKELLKDLYGSEGEYLGNNLQGALPAISLVSQTALLTAYSNDIAADMIFAQQVYAYGQEGDVLLGISTSGNSINVLNAIKVARVKGVKTIALTGNDGGELKELCDVSIIIPASTTPGIQERHLPVYHALCSMLEEEFFAE